MLQYTTNSFCLYSKLTELVKSFLGLEGRWITTFLAALFNVIGGLQGCLNCCILDHHHHFFTCFCYASDTSIIFFFEPYAEEESNSDSSCFHCISLAKHLFFGVIFWNVFNFLAALRVIAVLLSDWKRKKIQVFCYVIPCELADRDKELEMKTEVRHRVSGRAKLSSQIPLQAVLSLLCDNQN